MSHEIKSKITREILLASALSSSKKIVQVRTDMAHMESKCAKAQLFEKMRDCKNKIAPQD